MTSDRVTRRRPERNHHVCGRTIVKALACQAGTTNRESREERHGQDQRRLPPRCRKGTRQATVCRAGINGKPGPETPPVNFDGKLQSRPLASGGFTVFSLDRAPGEADC
jgi:hypothetical protein